MKELLLASCPVAVWVITGIEFLLMLLAFLAYKKSKKPLYLFTALVTLGLFYDALILALGGVLGDSELLRVLSQLRFVAHGALIPLLFLICAYALDFGKFWKIVVWVFTGALILLGAAGGLATVLEMKTAAGIVRYTSAEATPAWADTVSMALSYGAVVPLILAGIVVWIKQKTPLLFLAGFVMFLFSALGPATGNVDLIFYISMFGEVGMALFFLLYARRKAKKAQ